MLTQRGPAPYLIDYAPGRGAIARFDQDYDQIATVLDMLKAGGADGISLSPWLWEGIGDNDQYLDWYPTTGALGFQAETNLLALLREIAKRFSWIQVAPQFYDPNPLRVQTTQNQSWPRNVGMDAFVGTNLFMDWLTATLDQIFGREWAIDLVGEFNDVYPTNLPFQQYVKDTWARMTSLRSPGGVPCWNYSMSFTPIAVPIVLFDAFQGNWPAIFLPHIYSNEPTLTDALQAAWNAVPPSSLWILGETDTLQPGDESVTQQLVQFVQATKQRIICVCPWPIPTTWKKGDPFLAPPRAPTLWNTI